MSLPKWSFQLNWTKADFFSIAKHGSLFSRSFIGDEKKSFIIFFQFFVDQSNQGFNSPVNPNPGNGPVLIQDNGVQPGANFIKLFTDVSYDFSL